MEHHTHHMVEARSDTVEYLKFAGVLAAIALVAIMIYQLTESSGIEPAIRLFMGVFMVVFAAFKFVGYKMFVMMFPGYDLIANRVPAYSYVYPFIELGLGFMHLTNVLPSFASWLVILIMGIGSVGIIRQLVKGHVIHCACLGNIIKLPLSTVSLAEDVGMVLLAGAMLIIR